MYPTDDRTPWKRCSYCGREPINLGHTCPGLNAAANAYEATKTAEEEAEAARLQYQANRHLAREVETRAEKMRRELAEAARRAEAMDRLERTLKIIAKQERKRP